MKIDLPVEIHKEFAMRRTLFKCFDYTRNVKQDHNI